MLTYQARKLSVCLVNASDICTCDRISSISAHIPTQISKHSVSAAVAIHKRFTEIRRPLTYWCCLEKNQRNRSRHTHRGHHTRDALSSSRVSNALLLLQRPGPSTSPTADTNLVATNQLISQDCLAHSGCRYGYNDRRWNTRVKLSQ